MSSSLHLVSVPSLSDPGEIEFTKDIWDVPHIPGARYAAHRSDHLLNFTLGPAAFRPALKRHIRLMITRRSLGNCTQRILYVRLFLNFFVSRYPSASTLQRLSRADIEEYLLDLKTGRNHYGKPNSTSQIWRAVNHLKYFLEDLERTSSPASPQIAVGKLIWPEDGGSQPQHKYTGDKFIPESVLSQLEQHVHQVSSKYLPIVIILRASGWRIGDVLNLHHDTCLERTSSGWWLCGDILKTDVENHKVPLSDEIAAIVAAQRDLVKGTFSEEDNPHRYLFPSSHKERKGRPM